MRACAGYTEDEKKESHTKEISSRHKIVGGTAETRADLLKGITEERINAFIDVADQADEPIRTTWRPIWEMMAEFTQPECSGGNEAACDNYQRALNLEAAYQAWLALSCERKTARGDIYQEMQILEDQALASAGLQLYGCWARKEGCFHDDDCHIGGAGSVCYCYGEGCIVANKKTGLNIIQREKDDKSYDEGVNASCKYHVPVHCECDGDFKGKPDRYLWMQARD